MATTRFVPGAGTAIVTDATVALTPVQGVAADLEHELATADGWRAVQAVIDIWPDAAVVHRAGSVTHMAVRGVGHILAESDGERFELAAGEQRQLGRRTPVRHVAVSLARPSAEEVTVDDDAFVVRGGVVPASTVHLWFPDTAARFDPITAMFGATVERDVERAAVRPMESRHAVGVLVASDGRRIELDRPVIIGRNPRPDPELPGARLARVHGPNTSRCHAVVRVDGWTATVEDAGSTNGTVVEYPGQPPERLEVLGRRPLVLGTIVQVGPVSFTLEELA